LLFVLVAVGSIAFFSLKQEIKPISIFKIYFGMRSEDKPENIKLYIIQISYWFAVLLFFFTFTFLVLPNAGVE